MLYKTLITVSLLFSESMHKIIDFVANNKVIIKFKYKYTST